MANEGSDSPSYDKGLIQNAIGKNGEVQLVKTIKLELKGGDKIDTRILVITSFRFFFLTPNSKGPYKVDLSVHILDVHTIESKKPEQVVIKYADKQAKFCLTKPGSANAVIGQLIANVKINFPGGNLDESLRKDFEPSDKLEAINNTVNKLTSSESLTEAGPCGGFSRSYACICNHHGMPLLEEVVWDIDTIYLSHDTKEFSLQDFDHLEPRELIPIIATLEYNAWFTKLVCVSFKLTSEILDVIAKVIKRSTTLEELVLDGVSLGREFCQKLATALTSNPKSALERIDLCNNPAAEDRGIVHLAGSFSKLPHGLDTLNLHDTNISNKGAITIGQMLKNSKYMSTSLTRLNLSSNPLKVDGITVICDFLAQPNALTHLDLSFTECSAEQIFGALLRGCSQNLGCLNLSGNHFTNRKSKDVSGSFQQFLSSSAALHEIKMSECRLPPEAARAMFLGLIDNSVVKEIDVDISKNELKTAGVRAITDPLRRIGNLRSLDLSDNGFEWDLIPLFESLCGNKAVKKLYIGQNCNKGRNINNIMESLIKLISSGDSPLELLSLADSRLKQSITLLFDSLGTNESLTELDISGNMMGDEGARVLAKALQINNKLRTIHWDRNNVTQHGLRDIALAMENNFTLQSMPIPITDVALCLKPATEKALKQIEKCLSRNHSPSQAVTEQAYRLQQGLMMSSAQQQMVDKLIVQLQDTARILRGSSDETVKGELRRTLRCINDADKLKQLFLKFHMCTSYKSMEERISLLGVEIYNSIEQHMKENVTKILDCAESNCPFVTGNEGVKESLKVACEGKANVSKAFIDTVFLQQLSPVILNEVSEKSLNLSIVVADTMMDKVIAQLERHQTRLDLLLKEHQHTADQKPADHEEHNDVSEAAQKAKNRLSAMQNRRSMLLPDDVGDVFTSPSHHPKRRPTISRKRRTSEPGEDRVDGSREEAKKKEPAPVADQSLSVRVAPTKELVHHTKNRARPARGRRPPTRPSAQQGTPVGPEIVVENFDAGLDNFFTDKPARPQSAVIPPSVSRESAMAKSASLSQRPVSSKKKEKEEVEESHKEPPEKKKHGILGLFKKNKEKKSPTAPRKDSKNKDHRKSMENLVGAPSDVDKERKSVEVKLKPAEEQPGKTPPEKTSKRLPERPRSKPETAAASNEQEKAVKREAKIPPKPSEQKAGDVEKEKDEVDGEKEKETEKKGENEKEKEQELQKAKEETKVENGKETACVKDNEKENEVKTEAETSSQTAVSSEVENAKPQPKGPPKFGVGLAMGHGGDLLAEMRKRQEKNSGGNKPPSPEPKPRARVATSPDPQRPQVPVRPSSIKRSGKTKSAADLMSAAEADSKPLPKPRTKDVKPSEASGEQSKTGGEKKNDRKGNVGETAKVGPLKPAPKERPHVPSRPVAPKRPPSLVKPRASSQKDTKEQRKSAEVESATVEEAKAKETTEAQPVKESSGAEAPSGNLPEKSPSEKEGEKVPMETKPAQAPSAKEPEKLPSEKKLKKVPSEEKSETAPSSPTVQPTKQSKEAPLEKEPKKVPSEKVPQEASSEKPAEVVSMETPKDSSSVEKAPVEKSSSDEVSEKKGEKEEGIAGAENDQPKDGNDNDVSDSTKASPGSEDSTSAENVTIDTDDNVIKSSVDVEALAEATKDTLL